MVPSDGLCPDFPHMASHCITFGISIVLAGQHTPIHIISQTPAPRTWTRPTTEPGPLRGLRESVKGMKVMLDRQVHLDSGHQAGEDSVTDVQSRSLGAVKSPFKNSLD